MRLYRSHSDIMKDVETEEHGPINNLLERNEEKLYLNMGKIVHTKEIVNHNDQEMIQETKTITLLGMILSSNTTLRKISLRDALSNVFGNKSVT